MEVRTSPAAGVMPVRVQEQKKAKLVSPFSYKPPPTAPKTDNRDDLKTETSTPFTDHDAAAGGKVELPKDTVYAVAFVGLQMCTSEQLSFFTRKASGLKWSRHACTEKPTEGMEVTNEKLAEALRSKTELAEEESKEFGRIKPVVIKPTTTTLTPIPATAVAQSQSTDPQDLLRFEGQMDQLRSIAYEHGKPTSTQDLASALQACGGDVDAAWASLSLPPTNAIAGSLTPAIAIAGTPTPAIAIAGTPTPANTIAGTLTPAANAIAGTPTTAVTTSSQLDADLAAVKAATNAAIPSIQQLKVIEFDQEEWDAFKIPNLRSDNFIKVGNFYWMPEPPDWRDALYGVWSVINMAYVM
eukprot:308222-Prymnesium_polylepis.2